MLTQTYPLVKDPKLLLGVLQNIIDAVDNGVHALLLQESLIGASFEERMMLFKRNLVRKHRIPDAFLRFIGELQEINKEHKRSPIEFARKERFVICDESYRLRTLNAEQLRRHIEKAKAFVGMVEEKVNQS